MKGNENTARRSHPNFPPYGKGLTVSREVSPIQANPYFKDFVPLGDMRKLRGRDDEWRLRVGDWRVRFRFDSQSGNVVVLRVLPRGRAYRG